MSLIPLDYLLPSQTLDSWRAKLAGLGRLEAERPWAYGDIFLQGRELLDLPAGEFFTFNQIALKICEKLPKLGIPNQQWIEWGFVADHFPKARRLPGVPWAIYRELATRKLDAKTEDQWLAKADDGEWSVADLRRHLAGEASGPQFTGFAAIGLVPRKVFTDALRCIRFWKEQHPREKLTPAELNALLKDCKPLRDELENLERLKREMES